MEVYHHYMTRVAPIVPAEGDLLCENCGYTLNGLANDKNCPECGSPITTSLGDSRQIPAWEDRAVGNVVGRFFATTSHVILRPTHFYRTLATRNDVGPVRAFASIHWIIAAILFSISASLHVQVFGNAASLTIWYRVLTTTPGVMAMAAAVYVTLYGTTRLAAQLTAWEAAYRGYRLPIPVVLRGMYYHAAHYVPVALFALATVIGYHLLLRFHVTDLSTLTMYLYVLCGDVIVGAAYLFHTYWIGMRNMMYANR